MLSRRNFVKFAGLPPLLALTPAGIFTTKGSTEFKSLDKAPAIKSFSIFKATGNFYRFIGMNAYDTAPKGINGSKTLMKLVLADGTEGIGAVGYRIPDEQVLTKMKQMIGKDPFDFYNWKNDKIVGVKDHMKEYFFDAKYAWFESAVLDVIGKLKQRPVWQLMGDPVREGIDPYDGTLYFEDIANKTDVRIIAETGKQIKADGYRAIKVKLGRPDKWMMGEAGLQRDIDVFIALREAVGSNFILMADPNNGYRQHFDRAVKLLKACAPYNMFFIEEIFPDDTAMYQKLREALLEDNMFIPVAEGENINDLNLFDQYLKDGIYNYLQPDMHTCGFSYILDFAKKAEVYAHVKIIPHVWQSQLGLIMSLHAGKIQHNINFVEDSRYFEHAITTRGYLFSQGQWFIPDKPGWGVAITPDYKQFIIGKEISIS